MQTKETEKVGSAAELRQGDILCIEHVGIVGQGPNLGVIINADCDLAWARTDGVIAYLPIYSFRDYLQYFWMSGHLSDVLKTSTKKVLDLIRFEESYGDELLSWLMTAQLDEVFLKLSEAAKIKKNDHETLKKQLAKLQICINKDKPPLDAFSSLCRLEEDPKSYASKHLIAAKKAMGDGHFFISDLFGHEDIGFVIRMRRIYTLDADRCFTSISAQQASSNGDQTTAVRIARLTSLYQFKIAQVFAHQYSRIGLPDEITALGDLAIDDIASQIIKDTK